MYDTTRYINVLPQIIHGYNNTFHSGIKQKPNEVEDDDEVLEIMNKKYVKAKEEETKFSDGDVVRYVINRKAFEKRSLPKWSKQRHKITFHTERTYTLEYGKNCKYYEMQLVKDAEKMQAHQKSQQEKN